jgi:hypothetical protein
MLLIFYLKTIDIVNSELAMVKIIVLLLGKNQFYAIDA